MSVNHVGRDHYGNEHSVHVDHDPDECPQCHQGVSPRFLTMHVNTTHASSVLQVVYRCPRVDCQQVFVAYYNVTSSGLWKYSTTAPWKPKKLSVHDSVTALSPTGVAILNQVADAVARRNDQLVGIGLRKALEFLVKDYLIAALPAQADDIKKTMLGPCITKYVQDANIKACASRAAWLGNDETHYVRKWEDKDIADLQQLVRLTMNWIDNELMTKKYLSDMDAPKK